MGFKYVNCFSIKVRMLCYPFMLFPLCISVFEPYICYWRCDLTRYVSLCQAASTATPAYKDDGIMAKRGAHGFTLGRESFVGGGKLSRLFLNGYRCCCPLWSIIFCYFLLGLLTVKDFEQLD